MSNWRRLGFRTMFKRALDSGLFLQPDKNPFDSVFYESFEKILAYFSIENAML